MRILFFLILFLAGCAQLSSVPSQTLLEGKLLLDVNTVWKGEVLVDGQITVAHGVTLEILPGTNVRFVRRDTDRDGLGDATIIVKGSLIASGTERRPIRFLSAASDPQPADWLEIRSDFAQQLLFDWCEFRDSAYTLHAHFTRGHMRNSHIHSNIDGCRLGRSKFLFQYNLVENNSGKGINFRDSEVTLTDNIIRNNRAGIFLFEKPGKSVINGNNIYQNDINLQLGDFFAEDISLSGNWWGTGDRQILEQSVYDQQDDPELGKVETSPAPGWLFGAGIQHSATLLPVWQIPTRGFIDSTPIQVGSKIFFASWDGIVRAADLDGKLLWEVDTGDIIDSGLLAVAGDIYFQNWSRQLFLINQLDGQLIRLSRYPESPADDHRQASLEHVDELLLLPAWNGTLYAFEPDTRLVRWSYDAGMPLRAKPLIAQGTIYQTSGSSLLTALDFSGELLWQKNLGAPLLSTPALHADNLIVLDKGGSLTALKRDGSFLWQKNLGQSCFYAAPVVVDDSLFVVTAAGDIWKLNPGSGQRVWSRHLGGSIYATPTVTEAGLLVGDNNGQLYLLDSDSGRILAEHKVEGAIQSQVLVTGNRLYFGSRDRNLHALQLVLEDMSGE